MNENEQNKEGINEEVLVKENQDIEKETFEKLKEENKKLNEHTKELDERIIALEDMIKRNSAEFDNYKKRISREFEQIKIHSFRDVFLEFIPIYDNFIRAVKASEEHKDFDSLKEGLSIIYSQIGNMFKHFNIEYIDCLGKEFDHNLHEAVMMEERSDIEKSDIVTEEFERGYKINDIVIKHSKVKVAKKVNK